MFVCLFVLLAYVVCICLRYLLFSHVGLVVLFVYLVFWVCILGVKHQNNVQVGSMLYVYVVLFENMLDEWCFHYFFYFIWRSFEHRLCFPLCFLRFVSSNWPLCWLHAFHREYELFDCCL